MATAKKGETPKKEPVKRAPRKPPVKKTVEPAIEQPVEPPVIEVETKQPFYKNLFSWFTKTRLILIGIVIVLIAGFFIIRSIRRNSLGTINKNYDEAAIIYKAKMEIRDSIDAAFKIREQQDSIQLLNKLLLNKQAEKESREADDFLKKKVETTTHDFNKTKEKIYEKNTTQRVRDSIRDALNRAIEKY